MLSSGFSTLIIAYDDGTQERLMNPVELGAHPQTPGAVPHDPYPQGQGRRL